MDRTSEPAERPGYLFGQGDLPALRLRKLAESFDPATRAFLAQVPPAACEGPTLDLGCGPGFTTALLAERWPDVIGIDIAEQFLAIARSRELARTRFAQHDTLQVPLPGAPAARLFCRFLLTHLTAALDALALWRTQLLPGGLLLAQEAESIAVRSGPLHTYLDLLARVLQDRGHELYIGPRLGAADPGPGWRVVSSRARTHRVPEHRAAGMFSLNLGIWGSQPEVARHCSAHELAALAQELQQATRPATAAPDAVWQLRELIWQRV